MQDLHDEKRREFLKTSAKIAGGAVVLGIGASTLFAQGDWSDSVNYPIVPGHEMLGKVAAWF